MCKVATSPLPSWGSPTLSAGKIRNGYVVHGWTKWHITPAVLGVPNAQRGDQNLKWLSGPHVGKEATSPLPYWGSTTLSGGTKTRNGFVAHMWTKWLHHPCRLGGSQCLARDKDKNWLSGPHVDTVATSHLPFWGSPMLSAGTKIRNGSMAHMCAKWLYDPCRLGGHQRSARGRNQQWLCGPHVGKVVISLLLSWGSPTLNTGTKPRNGFVAHMWAKWLHHPCRLGGSQCLARDKDKNWLSGPHVDTVATSHLPFWGSPMLSAGTKIRNGSMAHMCAKWLYDPCHLGGHQRSARGRNQQWLCGPHVGKVAISLLLSWGSPTLNTGTKPRNGFVAHMWAKWLHHPCRLGGSQCLARDKDKNWLSGPHVDTVATSPLPFWGSPMLSAGTKIRNGSMAHMCAKWLYDPCRLGGHQRSARGRNQQWLCGPHVGKVAISLLPLGDPQHSTRGQTQKWLCGPHVGKVATSPLPAWGVPNAQRGDQKIEMAKWPECGQSGYITPAVLGVINAQRGEEIRDGFVAHMWAKWLHHPCRVRGPQHSAQGQELEIAQWPTCGQTGYIPPCYLGGPHAQRQDKNWTWLRGVHVDKVATSHVPSWGFQILSAGTKTRTG